MAQITYTNKETLNSQPSIADKNKVTSSDMNEIKSVVNTNYGEVGDITSLTTTDKTSVVNAINELKGGEIYSTSEVKTNKIWFDGKPIYRKIIVVDPYTSGGNVNIDELNIENITNLQALRKYNNQTDITYYNNNNDYFRVLVRKYNNQFVITMQGSNSGQAKVEIILEYTKTS